MDEFERSDLEKETNDSHSNFYQNPIHYQENYRRILESLSSWHLQLTISKTLKRKHQAKSAKGIVIQASIVHFLLSLL